jgi:hypothetical protein
MRIVVTIASDGVPLIVGRTLRVVVIELMQEVLMLRMLL